MCVHAHAETHAMMSRRCSSHGRVNCSRLDELMVSQWILAMDSCNGLAHLLR
jgi:hypothetical protein